MLGEVRRLVTRQPKDCRTEPRVLSKEREQLLEWDGTSDHLFQGRSRIQALLEEATWKADKVTRNTKA
jgi:hypothetical protein